MVSAFVVLAALLAYAYVGYAVLLAVLWHVLPRKHVRKGAMNDLRVSMVIPAYNEAEAIGDKLENVLSLDYPGNRLEIVVVSDASDDGTDEIVQSFAKRGVRLQRQTVRRGKIAAYEAVVPQLGGDIVVFSDATSILAHDALHRLLENFADASVGCVGAQVQFVNPGQAAVGKGVNTYWSYESTIRTYESDLDSLVSVSGTLYAVRRSLYPAGMRTDLADDLIVPLHVRALGLRTVFEPAASCVETTTLNVSEEIAKRTRITIQNIRGLGCRPGMMNPMRHGLFAVFLISHKLLRLLVPLLLIVALGVSAALAVRHSAFAILVGLQLAIYAGGLAGYLLQSRWRPRLLNVAFYFCLSNWAILLGIVRYLKGVRVATWDTLRRTEQ